MRTATFKRRTSAMGGSVLFLLAACSSTGVPAGGEDRADLARPIEDMTLWPPDRCRPGRWVLTDGTSHDSDTGLTWQRQDMMAVTGQQRGLPQAKARAYCNDLQLEGAGWYLPSFDELVTTLSQPKGMGSWAAWCAFPPPTLDPLFWTADNSDEPPRGFFGVYINYFLQEATGRSCDPQTCFMNVRCVRKP